MQRGYWQHPNGQIWAVETEAGRPIKCCGPFDVRDVDLLLLPCLDYSTRDLGFLQAEWRSYVPYVLCSACGGAVRLGAATAANGGTARALLAGSLKPPASAGDFSALLGDLPTMPSGVRPQRSKPLVLVADDSAKTRDLYALALGFSGFDAITSADGPEVIRLASERLPAVIVLDTAMPGLDGWDACRRLRAAPATSKILIIAVTGHALTGAEVAAKTAGCDVYLTKPLRPSRLVEEVRRILARS